MGRFFLSALLGATLASAGTNEVGLKFLEENKEREGVITLKSGLQYKVLRKGTGKFAPKVDSSCECHYAGTTPSLTENPHEYEDGKESEWTEFDSSYKRGSPTSFAPNQVIKGWTEAMQLMVEGDKWEMYIPSELGYGDGGSGEKIKGGDVLVFRMEILKINGGKKRVKKCLWAKIGEVDDEETACDESEIKIWKEWADKPLEDLQKKVDALEDKTKETMKKGEIDPILKELKELKPILKARKKMEKKKKTEL